MKKITAILLILCMMVGLSACAKNAAGNTETTAEKATEAAAEDKVESKETKAAQEADSQTTEAEAEQEEIVEDASPIIQAKVVEHTEANDSGDGEYVVLVSVEYPEIILSDDDAERFPKLVEALNKQNEEYKTEALNQLGELTAFSQEDYENRGGSADPEINWSYYTYNYNTHQAVARADEKVFSLYTDFFEFSGGAHGYYAYWGDNFDVETGKELELTDVITDVDTYKKIILEKLSEQYPDLHLSLAVESLADLGHEKDGDGTLPFLVGYDGVTCYFNPYAIASYAEGAQIITVMYNEAPEIFNEKYVNVPDSYVMPIELDATTWIDIKNDGVIDPVYIRQNYQADYEEGGYATSWTLTCADKEYLIKDYCYEQKSYVVKSDDKYFAYVFELSDNDYWILRVIDLETMSDNGREPENLYIADGDFENEDFVNGYRYSRTRTAFTNPENFKMATHVDALGTMSGTGIYHVGKDGWPESDKDYFLTETILVLQAKTDMDCKLSDADANEAGSGKIEMGKYYQVVRTDKKSWVDIQEVDKSLVNDVTEYYDNDYSYRTITEENFEADFTKPIYRIEMKLDEWPKLINGVDEDECFYGIQYAG